MEILGLFMTVREIVETEETGEENMTEIGGAEEMVEKRDAKTTRER